MKIINTEKLPIFLWSDYMEDGAETQAKHLANLPFVFKHVAIMPDNHSGYGMPIGGVIACEGVIIPNAVGKDIGCGVVAQKTNLRAVDVSKDTLKLIMSKIRKSVPVGFEHHKVVPNNINELMPVWKDKTMLGINFKESIVEKEYQSALYQLGTLGGGNHFIELQRDENDFIWIMIHSGSRNLGTKVADYYNNLAVKLNDDWKVNVPKNWQLAYLPVDSEAGKAYLNEMNYCVDFAFQNRTMMMNRIMEAFMDVTKTSSDVVFDLDTPRVNIAHNYAALENHFGKNVWVHRKGATLARVGTIGLVPGSQGTSSYMVEGLGNEDSFMSCSHGAGRKLSRSKAREKLNLEEEVKALNDKGILHSVRSAQDLDEAPGSYKDIDEVMENQKDLVKIIHKFTPLAVIKA